MRKSNQAALTATVALLLCWGVRLLVRHEVVAQSPHTGN